MSTENKKNMEELLQGDIDLGGFDGDPFGDMNSGTDPFADMQERRMFSKRLRIQRILLKMH